MRRIAEGLLLTVLMGSAARAQDSAAAPHPPRTTLEGAYSQPQARRGQDTYRKVCSNCHSTAEFSGSGFQFNWNGRTAFEFFELLRARMPLDDPGSLRRDEYAAVVAYIFEMNGFPAGKTDLDTTEVGLKRVRIVKKGG